MCRLGFLYYIVKPKPNGYRSLHLIVETPISLDDEKRLMKVEVQFLWIGGRAWNIKFVTKKEIEIPPGIALELFECAEIVAVLDKRMELMQDAVINNDIKSSEE